MGREWIVSRRVAAVRRERCRVGREGRRFVSDGDVVEGVVDAAFDRVDGTVGVAEVGAGGRETEAMSG